jgi:hypothetical protein
MQNLSAGTSVPPMTFLRVEREIDHRVVLAVGGSAGNVQPLIEIVRELPSDLPPPSWSLFMSANRLDCRRSSRGQGRGRQRMSETGRFWSMAGSTLRRGACISSLAAASPC